MKTLALTAICLTLLGACHPSGKADAGADAHAGSPPLPPGSSYVSPTLERKILLAAGPVDGGYACTDAGIDGGITCSGQCVNPLTSNANCGGCGIACNCTTYPYCFQCVDGGCCIERLGTCQYAPPGTCCPGTSCAILPNGTYACQ